LERNQSVRSSKKDRHFTEINLFMEEKKKRHTAVKGD